MAGSMLSEVFNFPSEPVQKRHKTLNSDTHPLTILWATSTGIQSRPSGTNPAMYELSASLIVTPLSTALVASAISTSSIS